MTKETAAASEKWPQQQRWSAYLALAVAIVCISWSAIFVR